MRKSWYMLIVILLICMVAIPTLASRAKAILQATATAIVADTDTPTAASLPATDTETPLPTIAAASATPITASVVPATATKKPATNTPFIITATPLTATASPIVITATPVPPTITSTFAVVLPTTGKTRRAEGRFMVEGIDTNQIAVDLANDCLTKAQDSQVLALCQQMSTAHATDIQQLHDLLLATYQIDYPPTSTSPATEAATSENVPGVVVVLTNLQGVSYDVAWLEAMIDVHTDLVAGANRILNFPISAPLRTMVQKMRTTATTEIATMQAMINRLGGSK